MFLAEVFAELLFFDTRLGLEDSEDDDVSLNDDERLRRRL